MRPTGAPPADSGTASVAAARGPSLARQALYSSGFSNLAQAGLSSAHTGATLETRISVAAMRIMRISAQRRSGLLAHLGNDFGHCRLYFRIGQRTLARLQNHGNRDRFMAVGHARAAIDIEHV